METMMSDQKFVNGDRVRHTGRPEWGIGTVQKVEPLPLNGKATQRLHIRFPNAGVKTLVAGHAPLERINGQANIFNGDDSTHVQAWDKLDGDWLGPLAKRKVEEAILSIPQEVRDPFNSLQKRLTLMLGLYRFDRSPRGLLDWAVAQTGLDDPLGRFTRPELEQKFDRWVVERDAYLVKLLQEARAPGNDPQIVAQSVRTAPPAAQAAVRRLIAAR